MPLILSESQPTSLPTVSPEGFQRTFTELQALLHLMSSNIMRSICESRLENGESVVPLERIANIEKCSYESSYLTLTRCNAYNTSNDSINSSGNSVSNTNVVFVEESIVSNVSLFV